MSSLPNENLEDALRPLDRSTLDAVQFSRPRFLQLIEERMSNVCLRQIEFAYFESSKGESRVKVVGRPERKELSNTYEDFASFFSAFFDKLRSSRVVELDLEGIDFTPALSTLVLKAPIIAHQLIIDAGSCARLTQTQFHTLVMHFAPAKLYLGDCSWSGPRLRPGQISDDFIRALAKSRVRHAVFEASGPERGDRFCVTDDAIVDFCVQTDEPVDENYTDEPRLYAELHVSGGRFSKDLFKRLLEASSASMRMQSLRVIVEPVRIEEEDLYGFAQHLSYCDDGRMRIYDFPGKPRGEGAPMDLQIALWDDMLFMVRAQRPNSYFRSSDE